MSLGREPVNSVSSIAPASRGNIRRRLPYNKLQGKCGEFWLFNNNQEYITVSIREAHRKTLLPRNAYKVMIPAHVT